MPHGLFEWNELPALHAAHTATGSPYSCFVVDDGICGWQSRRFLGSHLDTAYSTNNSLDLFLIAYLCFPCFTRNVSPAPDSLWLVKPQLLIGKHDKVGKDLRKLIAAVASL